MRGSPGTRAAARALHFRDPAHILEAFIPMQMKKLLPWAALVLGLAGGVVRTLDLVYGYDPVTLLPTDTPFRTMLIVLLLLSAAAFLLMSRSYRSKSDTQTAFESYFAPISTLSKTVSVLCAAVFALGGAGGFLLTILEMRTPHDPSPAELAGLYNPLLEQAAVIPLWILCILTAVMLFQTASACSHGFIAAEQTSLTTIPVFWAMYDLILTFQRNSGMPILSRYALQILSAALLALAFYYFSAFLFKIPRPSLFAFSSALAIVLALTSAGGILGAWLLTGTGSLTDLIRQACTLAAAVWLLAQLLHMPASQEPAYTAPGSDDPAPDGSDTAGV